MTVAIIRNNIKHLTKSEQKTLLKMTAAHGHLKVASDISGVHEKTIRNISISGYGMTKNVDLIREKLLSPANK